ncbi:MAG: sigma-70 family RNA polymerase sigma factor [Thermoguttaceae bacterium]|nr:sigma-70 family RNA polymerase sigma factor [Thermoguttaceae bacterium]
MQSDNTLSPEQAHASQVFLEHHLYVQRIALLFAPIDSLNGDIVNEVFLRFVENASKWDYNRDLRPLLKKMTKHVALGFWRDHVKSLPESLKRIATQLQQRSSTMAEEPTTVSDEEVLALQLCMKRLSVEQRDLLQEFYYSGKTTVQIAQETGQNVNTLYSILSRARNALRECILNVIKGK